MAQVAAAMAVYLWRFDDAEFDEAGRELRMAGHAVELEPRPLEILLQLLRHAGEVVTKDDLLDAVYGHRHLTDGAVAQAIRRLRRALNDHDQKIIVTVHRVGYKLIAEVRRTEIAESRRRPLLLKAGDRVPRREHWRLLQPLGGNEVEVWLIEHEKTHARRVLKLATDAARLSALKREVTLYRVLKEALGEREDLFTLIDFNFESSPYFIECEYGGVTLQEWAESFGGLGAIPIVRRLDMLAWAAEAVGAAHGANVLHKDLKPTNILAYQASDAAWRARLIDFGSGRLLDADRLAALRITQQGFTQQLLSGEESMSGTPLYLAPELIAGHMPTAQSDVYALGVILYQMAVADFRKPIASGWEDDVSDPLLREDIAAATHGNPARRLNSAQELAQRLRRLDRRPLARSGAAKTSLAAPPVHRTLRLVAAMTAVTAGIAAAGWQLWSHRSPQEIPFSSVASKESIDDYQQVLTVSHQRHESRVDELNSIKTLERAVQMSPRFADAWALLAQVNAHLVFNHFETESRRTAAAHALQKAIELQPNAPDTLIAQGYYSYWVNADYATAANIMRRVHDRWPEKRDATVALARISRRQNHYADSAGYFEEALAQDRSNMEWALGAAGARLCLGQFVAAGKLANHALDIDPTDLQAIGMKAFIYQVQGDLPSAAAVLSHVPARPGDYATVSLLAEQARLSRQFPAAISLWVTYLTHPESTSDDDSIAAKQDLAHLQLLTGDTAAAITTLREVRDELEKQRGNRPADPWPVASLAQVYADLGEPALARTLAASAASFEVVKEDADRAKLIDAIRASVATRLGDKDQAFDILQQLLRGPAKDVISAGLLGIDPDWDPLRSDARFATLIARDP
jgi:DNA-binding winged helix-turn-helix (wHTH) protein/serine/threonine protein kinase